MASSSILIVGAGPSGLVLAIWLKLLDPELKFRIVSNSSGPGTKSRAIIVHARSLEYYRQLGIADRIIAAGQIVESINIMQRGERRGQLKFGEMGLGQSKYPMVLALPQDRHEKVLLERFEELGGKVDWNTTVQTVDQEEDHVMVQVGDKRERYEYVVGCDGAHSAVRTSCGITMEGGTYSQRFYVADVHLAPSRVPMGLEITPGDGQVTIVLPLGNNDSKQIRLLGCYWPEADMPAGSESFEDVRDMAYKATKLKVQHVNWFSTYAVHHRFAEKFRDRRCFLVGDAAHLHSPVGGQGLNTGVGDASNLAWKLFAALSRSSETSGAKSDPNSKIKERVDDLLETYHEERVKFAKTLVGTTDMVFDYTTQGTLWGKFVREVFFPYIVPMVWKIAAVPPLMYRRASQTAIEYRGSAIGASSVAGSTIQPGDRVPFVGFDDGRDNYEPLDKPGWQIHTYSAEGADTKLFKHIPLRTWTWTDVAQQKGFGKDKVYLLRPDNHVGLIGDSLQDPKLEDYIVKWSI